MILVCLINFLKFHFIYYYFQYFIAYSADIYFLYKKKTQWNFTRFGMILVCLINFLNFHFIYHYF